MKYQKGQTLVEAIVALVTILLIVAAIAVVTISGLYNSQYIKNQNEANKYAQEGIEFVRNIQKNNITEFASYDRNELTYCINKTSNILTTVDCHPHVVNTGTNHNRIVTFSTAASECNASEVKVKVRVSWSTSKCPSNNRFCHSSELITCMPYTFPASQP